jgi:hypothetical protein
MTTRSYCSFKPLATRDLWCDNVLDSPRSYQFEAETYDENETGAGWQRIIPDWLHSNEAEIRTALEEHGFACPKEPNEDHEEFLERLRVTAEEFTGEHLFDLGLEPLMSYAYPIGDLRARRPNGGTCELNDGEAQAILQIYGSCLTLVTIDGEHCLALTGGGMDLSWEICEAYILLGQLPPAHFKLPAMAGLEKDARNLRIVAGCRRSYGLAKKWMSMNIRDLNHTLSRLVEPKEKK